MAPGVRGVTAADPDGVPCEWKREAPRDRTEGAGSAATSVKNLTPEDSRSGWSLGSSRTLENPEICSRIGLDSNLDSPAY